MEIVKLPKKFREVCYRIMDGDEEALQMLESFVKYPHQVLAVKAEVAYFNGDYDKALNYDMEILPYFNEWYYGNVGDEHRAAMVVAAIKLGREKELMKRFDETTKFLKDDDDSRLQPLKNISILKSCLKKRSWPYSDSTQSFYHEPEEPKSLDEIKEELKTLIKKKALDTPYGRVRLFYLACQKGTACDAAKVFEEVEDEEGAEMAYNDAILLFHFLGNKDKAIELIEKLATSRLWHVASATQVRPMSFFNEPVIVEYLTNPEILSKIREAAAIDNGTLERK